MIRLRSFSPLRAALRQGRSASGSCRSTIDPNAACSRCSCGPMNPDRPGVRRSTHRSSFGRRRDRTRRTPSCGSARRCQRLCARLDIHRAFAEAVAWGDGKLKRLGRVDMRPHLLEAFAKKLSQEDVVLVEATENASSVAAVIAPHIKQVVIATPCRCASSLMRRSRPIRSTRKPSPSFTRAFFSGSLDT